MIHVLFLVSISFFRSEFSVVLLSWGIQEHQKCQELCTGWIKSQFYVLDIWSLICMCSFFKMHLQIKQEEWSNLVKLELQSLLKWHHCSWHNMLVRKSDWKLNWCFVSRNFAERTTRKNTDFFQSLDNGGKKVKNSPVKSGEKGLRQLAHWIWWVHKALKAQFLSGRSTSSYNFSYYKPNKYIFISFSGLLMSILQFSHLWSSTFDLTCLIRWCFLKSIMGFSLLISSSLNAASLR